MSKIVTIKGNYTDNILTIIEEFILSGKIVIMPSDTIYGFLSLPDCEDRIRIIKNRDEKPFLFLISDFDQLASIGINHENYNNILKKYWPGSITFILKSGIMNTVGVRLPDNDILRNIIRNIEKPLISTSVNLSGFPPINNADLIIKDFGKKVDLIIIDKNFNISSASTIVDLTQKPYKIIRKGNINFNEI